VACKDQDASIVLIRPPSLQSMPSRDCISSICCHSASHWTLSVYLLLPWFSDILLSFKEGANVHCLASPQVSVDGPVKGEFEGATVEGAVKVSYLSHVVE
jgi:hypothetical protein